MSGLSRTPGKRVYGENRTEGSNPSFSAKIKIAPLGAFLLDVEERNTCELRVRI
jgi:hypothetical protein